MVKSPTRELGLDEKPVCTRIAVLRAFGDITVGDNEPYDIDPAVDYTTPVHAIRRGLLHLQVEFRQDEVATEAGQRWWAERFAQALGAGMAAIG